MLLARDPVQNACLLKLDIHLYSDTYIYIHTYIYIYIYFIFSIVAFKAHMKWIGGVRPPVPELSPSYVQFESVFCADLSLLYAGAQ